MKYFIPTILFFLALTANAQKIPSSYSDSLKTFQQNYIDSHEVVKGKDKQFFQFFSPDPGFRVTASFEKLEDSIGFNMKTSGTRLQQYFRFGKLSFTLMNTVHLLFVYQSKDLMAIKEYKDYLFVPFTDITSGNETYGGGRYIDLSIVEIKNNLIILDFNKAYNPYCAYATGFSCPIPPKENYLPVEIIAGERNFEKTVH